MDTLLISLAFSAALAVLVKVFDRQLTKLERLVQNNPFESFVVFSLCIILTVVCWQTFFNG